MRGFVVDIRVRLDRCSPPRLSQRHRLTATPASYFKILSDSL